MKIILLMFMAVAASCCHSKKTAGNNSPITQNAGSSNNSLPGCIQEMITKYASLQKHERPLRIYSYSYKGKTVYYVAAPCCDNFNELYSADCKLLGHPDGGFTGRGDGTVADWEAEKKEEKLVWEDKGK